MKSGLVKKVLGSAVVLTAPLLLGTATQAHAAGQGGALVIPCSDVFSYLGGVILFQPNGDFKANCWEHVYDGTPGRPVEVTTVFNCSEQFPAFIPEWLVGIQVITSAGNILTNCHVHVSGGAP